MENGASNADSGEGGTRTIREREIYKVGWLKIIHSKDKKFVKPFQNFKTERIWAAFCVHDDTKPFLEFFDSPQRGMAHQLTWEISLDQCVHITPSICPQDDNDHVFSITIPSQVIRLGTDNRVQMNDWINTLRDKLAQLKVLESSGNLYSKEPEPKPILAPNRDPTSPLPPTPGYAPPFPGTILLPVIPHLNTTQNSDQQRGLPIIPPLLSPLLSTNGESVAYSSPNPSHSYHALSHIPQQLVQVADEDNVSIATDSSYLTAVSNLPTNSSAFVFLPETLASTSGVYEPLFVADQPALLAVSSSTAGPSSLVSNDLTSTAISPLQSRQSDLNNDQSQVEATTHLQQSTTEEEGQQPVTLKEQQVLNLAREISHKAGVKMKLPRKDCMNMIAFVEFFGCVWIAGWRQKECPFLYNKLHLGDRIITVGGSVVYNVHDVQKIFRHTQVLELDIVLARVPYGKVLAIKRDIEGQDLGIVRDGNTALIKKVVDGGLASRHGLPSAAPTLAPASTCNWVLTEINGRPLNLFFKGNEVKDRLNAVGKDISILVQPSELVNALKKQLKAMRNYKDYIVQ